MKEGKDGSRRDQVEGGCLIQVSGAGDSPREVAKGCQEGVDLRDNKEGGSSRLDDELPVQVR